MSYNMGDKGRGDSRPDLSTGRSQTFWMWIEFVAYLPYMLVIGLVLAVIGWQVLLSGWGVVSSVPVMAAIQAAASTLSDLIQADTWFSQLSASQIATNLAFGFAAGLALGLIQLWRMRERRKWIALQAVEGIDPTAVSAAGVGMATLGLHILISMAVAFLIAGLGVSLPFDWFGGDTGGVDLSPVLHAWVAAGGSDGGGDAPDWQAAFWAIVLVLIVIGLAAGLVIHAVAAVAGTIAVIASPSVAAGLAGAQVAAGRVIGADLIVAMTRARTGRPFSKVLAKPLFERDWRAYQALVIRSAPPWRQQGAAHALAEFNVWAKGRTPLTKDTYAKALEDYRRETGVPSSLQDFANSPAPKAVPIRGEAGALFYPGWIVTSLLTGMKTGFISGVIYAVFVLTAARMHG